MKDNLKNALMIVAALLLVVYVGAFFVMMRTGSCSSAFGLANRGGGPIWAFVVIVPRDAAVVAAGEGKWMYTFFAPLIWTEKKLRGKTFGEWRLGEPKPSWVE